MVNNWPIVNLALRIRSWVAPAILNFAKPQLPYL